MSSTGTSMRQVEPLLLGGVDDGDGTVVDGLAGRRELVVNGGVRRRYFTRALRLAPSLANFGNRWHSWQSWQCGARAPPEKPRHLVQRPLRRRQADPLHPRGQLLEPFERQRQVGAALGRHQRVDLVDDHRVDRAQRFARVRGQQQIERLGRGDQDVGRLALEAGALGRRRVAGADGNRRDVVRRRRAPPRGWRSRRAARGGCARCRPPAPSAARGRARGSATRAAGPARTSAG